MLYVTQEESCINRTYINFTYHPNQKTSKFKLSSFSQKCTQSADVSTVKHTHASSNH